MTSQEIKNHIDKIAGFDISNNSRKTEFIKYRSLYSFLCHRYAEDGHSFASIARVIKKDDNTIRHSIKTFESFMLTDIRFRSDFDSLRDYVVNETSKETHDKLKYLEMINLEVLRADLIRRKMKTKAMGRYLRLEAKRNKSDKAIK